MLTIKSGFQPVITDCFRKRSLSKGRKLLESFHVSNVKEDIVNNVHQISGEVLRETPGAKSEKLKTNIYKPNVKVKLEHSKYLFARIIKLMNNT